MVELIKESLTILEKRHLPKNEVSVEIKNDKVIFNFMGIVFKITKLNEIEEVKSTKIDFYNFTKAMSIIDRAFADYKTIELRNEKKG